MNSGDYYFLVGGFEQHCFQNCHVKNSSYIGRATTKEKYLGLKYLFDMWLYTENCYNDEVVISFIEEYKQNITGDLYLVDNQSIVEKLDCLTNSDFKPKQKQKIKVMYDNKEIEAYTYFRICDSFEEELKLSSGIINEYSQEDKIKAMEVLIQLQTLKGKTSKVDYFELLNKLKVMNEII